MGEAHTTSFLRFGGGGIGGGSLLLDHFQVRVSGAGNERGRGGKNYTVIKWGGIGHHR